MSLKSWIDDKVQAFFARVLAPQSSANPVSSPPVTQTVSSQPAVPPVALNVAPTTPVTAVANAVSAVAGLADDELRLHNSPAMQANAQAIADQQTLDRIRKAQREGDIETLRKLGS